MADDLGSAVAIALLEQHRGHIVEGPQGRHPGKYPHRTQPHKARNCHNKFVSTRR